MYLLGMHSKSARCYSGLHVIFTLSDWKMLLFSYKLTRLVLHIHRFHGLESNLVTS